MGNQRTKFATQMDSVLLEDLRRLAKSEGRHIQALIEEAVESLLQEKGVGRPRSDVLMLADELSETYSETLKYLAQ